MLNYNFADRLNELHALIRDRKAFMRLKVCEVSRELKLLSNADSRKKRELSDLKEILIEEYELAGEIIERVDKAKADFENKVSPTEIVKNWHVKTTHNKYVWSAVFCKSEEFADIGYVDIHEVFRLHDHILLDVTMGGEALIYLAMGLRDEDYMPIGEPIMSLKLFPPFNNEKERRCILGHFEGMNLSDFFKLVVHHESEVLADV